MKMGFPMVGMILLLLILTGCGNGSEKKVEESVSLAEQRSTVLKSEINYSFRLEKYYAQAFSLPNEKIVTRTTAAYTEAKKVTGKLNDGTSKELFLQRLDAVKKVITDADRFAETIKEGNSFVANKKAFMDFVTKNPLSPELEKRTEVFSKKASELETKKNSFASESFRLDYENIVLADSRTQIEKAQNLVSIQQKFTELKNLISAKRGNYEIAKKISELNPLLSGIEGTQIQEVLNAKKAEILRPYFVRIAEEKRIGKEIARKKAAQFAAWKRDNEVRRRNTNHQVSNPSTKIKFSHLTSPANESGTKTGN